MAADPGSEERPPADTAPVAGSRSLKQRLRWPLMLAGPVVVGLGGLYFYLTGGRYESTDDAYVRAATVAISANVAGRVSELDVHDNQVVHRGQVLFRLDDRALRLAVAEAQAELATARLQIDALKASYRQRQAELQSAQDTLTYQQQEYARQKRLRALGVASQAQFDQAAHTLDEARQKVAGARQVRDAVLANLGGDPALPLPRHPAVQQAQAELDRARLNLSYTVITAPSDGIVTQVEQLQVGEYITAATPVFSLVSNRDVWIEANFKEVQLTHMRVGQTARVDIDTYPGRTFKARVMSFSPGTGAQFSVLPPENATGNWVKVVQRLPVRLAIASDDPAAPLRDGFSATVTVDTQYHRFLWGRARPSESGRGPS